MSIQTGVGAPMISVIIALCVLFVIGVGITERRRLKKNMDKDEPDKICTSGAEEDVNVI